MKLSQNQKRWLFGLATIISGLLLIGLGILPSIFQTRLVGGLLGVLTLLTGINVIQRNI